MKGPVLDKAKVAAVNFEPIQGDREATFAKMRAALDKAAAQGCDLAVFPEMAFHGFVRCPDCKAQGQVCAGTRWATRLSAQATAVSWPCASNLDRGVTPGSQGVFQPQDNGSRSRVEARRMAGESINRHGGTFRSPSAQRETARAG